MGALSSRRNFVKSKNEYTLPNTSTSLVNTYSYYTTTKTTKLEEELTVAAVMEKITIDNEDVYVCQFQEQVVECLKKGLPFQFGDQLTCLKLMAHFIGDHGVSLISNVLLTANKLSELNLYGNNVTSVGLKALTPSIIHHPHMKILSLAGNNIDTEGGKSIATIIKSNQIIETIKLQSNHIGTKGAKAIGRVLQYNCVLKELDLRSNNIGEAGGRVLETGSKKNYSLNKLLCDGSNHISDTIKKNIKSHLEKNNGKCLVIPVPLWWDFMRLLWIGHLKENPETCFLASLPKEILIHILRYCNLPTQDQAKLWSG